MDARVLGMILLIGGIVNNRGTWPMTISRPALWKTFAPAAAGLAGLWPLPLLAVFGAHGEPPDWLAQWYALAPALVIGLAALVALPVLAFAGALLRWSRQDSSKTQRVPSQGASEARDDGDADRPGTNDPAWTIPAWIEMEGSGARHEIGRDMIRVGRADDNDMVLPYRTVHRYHAIIHRTGGAEFKITDLSSSEGNGIIVNGQRVPEARLWHGDTVQLGEAVFKFYERPPDAGAAAME